MRQGFWGGRMAQLAAGFAGARASSAASDWGSGSRDAGSAGSAGSPGISSTGSAASTYQWSISTPTMAMEFGIKAKLHARRLKEASP